MRGWTAGGWLACLGVLLPWLTWIPLTTENPHAAVLLTPYWLLALGLLGALAGSLVRADRWLGVWIGVLVLRALPNTWPGTFEVVFLAALGAQGIVWVRALSRTQQRWLIRGLTASALGEAAYVGLQWLGWDPIWRGTDRAVMHLVGTLGNGNYVGAYLAMVTPLAPLWAMPVLLGGIGLSMSFTGMIAASIGILVRVGVSRRIWMLAGGVLALVVALHGVVSLQVRSVVWLAALRDQTWLTVCIGHGLGGWISRMPAIQPWQGVGEWFMQAHNDYLQLWYEAGLLGLLPVLAWIWTRRLWEGPYAGAAVAVGVVSATMFPFHLAVTGLTAVVVLGLATAPVEVSHE